MVLAWALAHADVSSGRRALSSELLDTDIADMDALLKLGALESKEHGDGHVGLDHLILALTRPECPGSAPAVLASLGVGHEELGHVYRETVGQREVGSSVPRRVTTAALLAVERAAGWCATLEDDRVSSEHFLLALSERWGESPLMDHLARLGIDSEALRQRAIAITEGTAQESAEAAAASPTPRPAALDLAPGPGGSDPRERQPWSSIVLSDDTGMPIKQGRNLIQYFVDKDGALVRTTHGDLVHVMFDDRGRIVYEGGRPRLVPVRLPAGHTPTSRLPA
jgi:ATP-dependent Clp protease ATP-binding subunit ClpA